MKPVMVVCVSSTTPKKESQRAGPHTVHPAADNKIHSENPFFKTHKVFNCENVMELGLHFASYYGIFFCNPKSLRKETTWDNEDDRRNNQHRSRPSLR